MEVINSIQNFFLSNIEWIINNPHMVLKIVISYLTIFVLIGFFPIFVKSDEESTKVRLLALIRIVMYLSAAVAILLGVMLWFYLSMKLSPQSKLLVKEGFGQAFDDTYILLMVPFVIAPLLKVLHYRMIAPTLSNLVTKYAVKQSASKKSDIRQEVARMKSQIYDARKYYKPDQVFMGLTMEETPHYISLETFKTNHIKNLGPTQTGKGVFQGLMIDQCIYHGLNVFFHDIKPDDFMYTIMVDACKTWGRNEPLVLDINGIGDGYYSPFCSQTEQEQTDAFNRLKIFLNLQEKGTDADHYKISEALFLEDNFDYISERNFTLDSLIEVFEASEYEKSYKKLKSLKRMACISDEKGYSIQKLLDDSTVMLIRGSVTNQQVKEMHKLMIMDFLQNSLRNKPRANHTFHCIDEVRYVVSDVLSVALATILSKNVSIAISFQSEANLKKLEDITLDGESIAQELFDNTNITVTHRVEDPEMAEKLSAKTGEVNITIGRTMLKRNALGGEVFTGERMLNDDQQNYITANQLFALPKMCNVTMVPNALAVILRTSPPVKLRKNDEMVNGELVKSNLVELPERSKLVAREIISDSPGFSEVMDDVIEEAPSLRIEPVMGSMVETKAPIQQEQPVQEEPIQEQKVIVAAPSQEKMDKPKKAEIKSSTKESKSEKAKPRFANPVEETPKNKPLAKPRFKNATNEPEQKSEHSEEEKPKKKMRLNHVNLDAMDDMF